MISRPYNVLFVCTGNSARSIFAEALLRDTGGGRFRAFSAGTTPQSVLNPLAVQVLEANGHETASLRAKHVSEFQGAEAPALDFVFTVCDRAANEDCPGWPGQPAGPESLGWGGGVRNRISGPATGCTGCRRIGGTRCGRAHRGRRNRCPR